MGSEACGKPVSIYRFRLGFANRACADGKSLRIMRIAEGSSGACLKSRHSRLEIKTAKTASPSRVFCRNRLIIARISEVVLQDIWDTIV